ncbi:ras guanine nucleotide exchange factor domain-containing protein [Astrocystis sublimbata]|nr:ras guanine nucleotide exchange factor domain-containing protein [Astrocystis sublimbata]
MNGIISATPPGTLYVRAMYDYEADDRTSLSFHEGDVIQVITQLESGWWDGVINGVRGWFPSNYCQAITGFDDMSDPALNGEAYRGDDEFEDGVLYEEEAEMDNESDMDDYNPLLLEGARNPGSKSGSDFWIPQATSDGRLYYYNTMTGESSTELPLESPTSLHESGPRDRMHVNVPEKTRPPPEMMARGLTQDEDEDSEATSASELDGESLMMASMSSLPSRQRRAFAHDAIGISPSPSMDSMNGTSVGTRSRADTGLTNTTIPTSAGLGPAPVLGSATSFTQTSFSLPQAAKIPHSFFDDGSAQPLSWNLLVANMKRAIDRYREAITTGMRSEYVSRAEDISDHLRLLLAAGSGTTDNHSGQPSIISTNKALYPHFRDMMSKFSKLVISSHIAAADWPNAESVQKCMQEAEGVLMGVYSFVEVARQQRGEEIPRLFPGFVIGSTAGGSWQNNALGPRDLVMGNYFDDDESGLDLTVVLDGKTLERVDDLKRMLVSGIRELDKHLTVSDKIITPYRHELIGNAVCSAGGRVLEMFKPWIALIESIDLSPLENDFRTPQLADFSINKQSLYDNISDLLIGCQAVAGPLGDEWTEVRGESLENRLDYVAQCARALEQNSSHVAFSLQLLSEQVQISLQQSPQPQHEQLQQPQQQQQKQQQQQQQSNISQAREEFTRDPLRRGETLPYNAPPHSRNESRNMVLRPQVLGSQSYSEGESAAPSNNFRKGDLSKVMKILGDDPTPQGSLQQVEESPFLRLDLEKDLSWDTKTNPPSCKGGSLLALVELLTRHDKLDANFNNTFLLTYRSFTSARELFELLVKRFNIQPPEGLQGSDYDLWRDKKQKPIRFRVVNILRSWFENFWLEEPSDESRQLIRDVHAFAKETVPSTETPGSASLITVLDQRLGGKEISTKRLVQTFANNIPTPIMPKNMKKLKFLDIDVTEFARQLTVIESKLYAKIKPSECLNKTWQKKVGEGEPEPAPNVKTLILHSNQMTNWVAEMILAQMDVKKRVVVIKHFVSVADKCRGLNNFSTLTSIISALGTAPIARLKRTWDQVPARTNTVLDSMRRLMASTKNFGEYRESLHAANPPCIPFFGVYLTDLTFIEDGIPSIMKKTNMINFAKRAKTAEVIRDIQQYQNAPYSLQPVPELQDYILSNMTAAGDVHEMYDKSLVVEPREREDEKIVRVLAESGFL